MLLTGGIATIWHYCSEKKDTSTPQLPSVPATIEVPRRPIKIERRNLPEARPSVWSFEVCQKDCVVGSGCVSPNYPRPGWCSAGPPCSCASGIACLPGNGSDLLKADERFRIGFSFVARYNGDPCVDNADKWMCLRVSSGGSWNCATQKEACENRTAQRVVALTETTTAVSGSDLTQTGLDLAIWSSKPSSDDLEKAGIDANIPGLVAITHSYKYLSISRMAACRGLAIPVPEVGTDNRWNANLILLPE